MVYLSLGNDVLDTLDASEVSSVPAGVAPEGGLQTVVQSQWALGPDNLSQSIHGALVLAGLVREEVKKDAHKPRNRSLE